MTRAEVLANRRRWIDFLKKRSKKTIGSLDHGGGHRCCLGHGCYALGIKRTEYQGEFSYGNAHSVDLAPQELIDAVGLWSMHGSVAGDRSSRPSLTQLNDDDDWSPKRIAQYLEENIQGGESTPWRALEEYPE